MASTSAICEYDELPVVSKCLVATGTLSTTLELTCDAIISNKNTQTRVELTASSNNMTQLFDQLSFFKSIFHHLFALQLSTNDTKLLNIQKFNIEKLTYNTPADGEGWQIIITFISAM